MKRRKAKARLSAGFELERLGLWALRYPRMALLLIALVTPPLIWASSQLGFSSDIREIFRSGSADFSRLEEVAAQYPGTGRDILLVIEDENLFTVETLDRLRELHLALPLIDGVKYVHSMFSARSPPDAAGKTTQLFPFEMSQIKDLEALQEAVRAHPLIGDKLLSRDGSLCLFVVALKEENREVEELRALVSEIRTLADEELDTARTDLAFTGLAVMRIEIIGALKRDQRLFGLVGMSIGVLLCWIYFRSLAYVVIAMAPAGLAIMWLRGSMHLAGQEMNVLTNVVPVIVMVIVLANALHLLFGIRRGLQQGAKIEAAIEDAVRTIGPATVLTSATTTLALLSLMLVQHAFITRFGLTAAVGTAIAYIATMSAVPPLALFMLGHSARAKESIQRSEPLMRGIARFSAAVARFARTQPTAITLVGVALAGICALLFAANETRYRYLDNLPTANPAYQAIAHIDQKLAGPNLLQLLVQWRDGARFDNGETLLVVAKAHGVLTSEPAIKAITSLTSVATWFAADGRDSKDLFAFLEEVRSPTASRVYSADKRSALLSANFPDLDAAELLPILDRIEEKLDGLRQRFQGIDFVLTGIVPVSARASTEMIAQLNLSLLIAIAVIIALIGLAFRSLTAGLVSILPNILPIAIAGAGLYLFGTGLQFTTVVAFTIGFGIAVDNTIHVLNRYRLAREAGLVPADAIEESVTVIGPVLIVSTSVLICGIGATVLSELPMVRLYGRVSITVLASALIGAMVFLPAILRIVEDLRSKRDVKT